MAIYKDVVVNIQKLTAALTSENSDMCLILTTATAKAYAEYSDLTAVAADYASGTTGYAMASAIFSQEPKPAKVAIVGISKGEPADIDNVIDGLNTLIAANNTFNYIVSDITVEADIAQIATWATANKKFYAAVLPVNSISTAANPESDYVIYFVHDIGTQYPDAALIGRCSTFTPGSATWMFKSLNGISPVSFDDQATMIGLINEKHYMTYVKKYGANMTTGGFVTSGEYVDVMLGIQWIQREMELRIQSILMTTPKVPYDNGGIALLAGQVETTLKDATANGIIRKGKGGLGEYTINIPDVSNIPANDIANRELKAITWNAKLAGAIHHVDISGVVQY